MTRYNVYNNTKHIAYRTVIMIALCPPMDRFLATLMAFISMFIFMF